MSIWNINTEELLQAAKESEEGFADLLRQLEPWIMYRIRSYRPEDEEEIFQEISLKIYRNLAELRPETLKGWIKTAVQNACTDEWRKRSRRSGSEEDAVLVYMDAYEDWDMPDEKSMRQAQDAITDEYRRTVLDEVFTQLPEKQRAVVMMYVHGEMNFREIAETLGEAESTVKSRMNAARKTIAAEVTRIQKRGGTKLYNFTPFTFFLWLLRGKEDGTVPADRALCERAARNAWQGSLIQSGQAAAAGKTGAALGSAAAKGGAGIGIKLAVGAAAVALLAGGGYMIARGNSGPAQADIDSDVVTFTSEETIFRLHPGESVLLNITLASENGIEYTPVYSVDNTSVASVTDNVLTANGAGQAVLRVSTKPEHASQEYEIVVVADAENGYTALGQLMRENGYTRRYEFRPIEQYYDEGSLPILYDSFDDAIFDADVNAYLDGTVYLAKGLNEEMTRREADAHGYADYFEQVILDEATGDVWYYERIDALTGSVVIERFEPSADGSTITVTSGVYGYDTYTFTYDPDENTYSCAGDAGMMYLDITLPFDTIYSTAAWKVDPRQTKGWTFTYDDQHRPVQAETPPMSPASLTFDIQYDDTGRVTRIIGHGNGLPWEGVRLAQGAYRPGDASDLWIDFYYNDNGLLRGAVRSVMYNGQRVIDDIAVYAYE